MTVYLPDTNVWLALALDWHPAHAEARIWWEGLDDRDRVLICRPVQLSTLRLLTTRAVFVPGGVEPLTNAEAWAVMDEIADDHRVELRVLESPETGELWRASSELSTASPKVWMDSFLSAFAQAVGATLVTNDRGLARAHPADVLTL